MPSRIKTLQNKAKINSQFWERLELLPEDLYKHPTITPILVKSLGSIDKVIEYLRSSSTKEAIELLRIWDLGSIKEHKIIPFEAYCLSAKSTPKAMMGIIMQAIVEQSNLASELLVATAHPEIVQKTIKIAKTKAGADERKAILQNRGFLPAPKNQVFNNYGNMTQDNRKQVANVSVGQLSEDDDKISEAVDKFNAERVLKAGNLPKVEVIDITAEE